MTPFGILLAAFFSICTLTLTQTRRFYFIRHGETLLNAQHLYQGKEGALSETGKRQAATAGVYLTHRSIDLIITSTYPRALETAEIIQKQLRVPIRSSPLLAERRNPSEVVGYPTRGSEARHIIDQIDLSYHEDEYRYSDEENFVELKQRARKCLALLARQGAPQTAVVTHHVFLKMLVSYMLYREELHAADFVKLSFFNVSDNAGITICEFNPWLVFSKTRGWSVISYNEQPQ